MKKIDKNYLKWCALLLKTLPKLKKYSNDVMVASCIKASSNKEYKEWIDNHYLYLTEKSISLFNQLDTIVRNLLPYLSDDSIARLCSMEVSNEVL